MEKVNTPEEGFTHWFDEDKHSAINPVDYVQALVDEMRLRAGDVYLVSGEANQVEAVRVDVDKVVITDPTASHPQDSRSGQWSISVSQLYREWKQGKITPTVLEAV